MGLEIKLKNLIFSGKALFCSNCGFELFNTANFCTECGQAIQREEEKDDLFYKILESNNYYEILGVNIHTKSTEIKEVYKSLAKKYHPDKCKNELSRNVFQKINKAYSILIDDSERLKYNRDIGAVTDSKKSVNQTNSDWSKWTGEEASELQDQTNFGNKFPSSGIFSILFFLLVVLNNSGVISIAKYTSPLIYTVDNFFRNISKVD